MRLYYYCLITAISFMFLGHGTVFGGCLEGESNCNNDTTISLQIINTFGGTASLLTGSEYFMSGGVQYTAQNDNEITVGATTRSTYVITGDIAQTVTGSGVGEYTAYPTVSLTPGDGLKDMSITFYKGSEWFPPTFLSLFLDTTPPSRPEPVTPLIGEFILSEGILFSWTPSNDTASGFKEYILSVSRTPSMNNPIEFTTNNNVIIINQDLLPENTLYWTVTAVDNVGNENTSTPSFFSVSTTATSSITPGIVINETDGVPEAEDDQDKENMEVIDHNKIPDELLIFLEENPDKEHGIAKNIFEDDSLDQKITYLFQVDKKPSVIEIIKKNNEIQVLINQMAKDRHLVVTQEMIEALGDTSGSLILPRYLFRTGGDIQELKYHLQLLATYFPDSIIQDELKKVIRYLLPYRRGGSFIFIALLCYDIETYKRRLRAFYKKK